MSRVVRSGSVVAHADVAHAVHVIADGLQPAREYWYQFRCGPWLSGRPHQDRAEPRRTCRPAVARRRIVSGVDRWPLHRAPPPRRRGSGRRAVPRRLRVRTGHRRRRPRCRRCRRCPRRRRRRKQRRLDAYRLRYALYKSDPDLQAAHRAAPWMVAWDDHEVEDGYAGAIPRRRGLARRTHRRSGTAAPPPTRRSGSTSRYASVARRAHDCASTVDCGTARWPPCTSSTPASTARDLGPVPDGSRSPPPRLTRRRGRCSATSRSDG